MQEVEFFPRITNYTDYHQFLRDFFDGKKAQSRTFSYRKFAQLSKIKSSNFLMLVMNNQRKLSLKTARSVAGAMKLTKNESDYFVALVRSELAGSNEEREQIEKDKRVAVKRIIAKDLPADKAEYLGVWYYPVVREMALLADFKPNAAWISAKMNGVISQEQADKAIHLLTRLGMWKKDRAGRTVATDIFVDSGAEDRTFGEISVTETHRQNLTAWSKVIERIPKEQRELGLLHIPVREERIPELKARIQKFQDEIIGWLQDEKDPTRIVQLGTYLIPLTKGEL